MLECSGNAVKFVNSKPLNSASWIIHLVNLIGAKPVLPLTRITFCRT